MIKHTISYLNPTYFVDERKNLLHVTEVCLGKGGGSYHLKWRMISVMKQKPNVVHIQVRGRCNLTGGPSSMSNSSDQ